ncbi:MAG: carbohydrate kinase family protein [Gammaproteobacteria bacterium]|nr:carbohydrate kinase family protein [Gammaproteobacteria bacterium]
MSALICGSFAYDTIMVFQDRFKNHILPDKLHILNVSFQVPQMRREYGGCAGNIAYNLKLLGGDPLPMGTAGKDFGAYAEWMNQHGIDRRHIKVCEDSYTAQAFITTDLDDNQITAFHPGAMNRSHETRISDASGVKLGIISPDGREGMLQHAREFAAANIPFIFDPGQAMPLFNGQDFLGFLEQATWVSVNDYEAELLQERTGKSLKQLAGYVKALVVTLGAKGSCIYAGDKIIEIPCAAAGKIADPTGCGDAYRAGLLLGLARGMDWETTGRIASLIGAIKIAHPGTQNHHFTPDQFAARFRDSFGYSY